MTTIRDVAAAAGVSTATVSRALSGRGYVSAATRARVEAAAAGLGFSPNPLARGLKTRRSGLVGLVVPEIRDPFFAAVAQGLDEVASARGLTVIVGASLNDREREATYLRLLASRSVDGVIVAPAREAERTLREVSRLRLPAVFVDDYPEGPPVDAVHSDNVDGARRLTAHLVGLGHRRIGLVMGRAGCAPGGQRTRGHQQALAEAGIPEDRGLLRHGPWTGDFAAAAVAELLALPDPPTALLTGSAMLTAGALGALRERGLRVPEDIAVVGFDALPMADAVDPFLTVAAQRVGDLCRQAAELLVGRIDGSEDGPPREIVVPMDLTIRRSCGAAG